MRDNLVPVSMSSDVLRIDGFETSERDIVSYFAGLPDLEDADKELERLLKLSILAQGSVGTMLYRRIKVRDHSSGKPGIGHLI